MNNTNKKTHSSKTHQKHLNIKKKQMTHNAFIKGLLKNQF